MQDGKLFLKKASHSFMLCFFLNTSGNIRRTLQSKSVNFFDNITVNFPFQNLHEILIIIGHPTTDANNVWRKVGFNETGMSGSFWESVNVVLCSVCLQSQS